jgi:hypothetical protein
VSPPDSRGFGHESDRAEKESDAWSERSQRECGLPTSDQAKLGHVKAMPEPDAFGESVRVDVAHPEDERR